ncbi:DUF2255 family protein [Catenuloplanes japonicus]|uniref:DUF2255 family protein n=1 Tax=Catenuloplanes japonicus TaxID=33876 RepID=UPI000A4AF485|nr:DUF2255 family protein [Catenuloplanes japonicus]
MNDADPAPTGSPALNATATGQAAPHPTISGPVLDGRHAGGSDAAWTADDLRLIDAADELEIAARRTDGSLRRRLPIWVVRVRDHVYVRTWYRRDTGWFAHVLRTGRAAVRVPGLESDVTVHDVGSAGSRTEVDAAYQAKYRRYGSSATGPMVTDAAAATTLRLSPDR